MTTNDAPPSWNAYAAVYETVHEPLTRQFADAALELVPIAASQRIFVPRCRRWHV